MSDVKITDIQGIGGVMADRLMQHDFTTVDAIINSSIESLCQVPGIKEFTAKKIQENALVLLHSIKKATNESEEKTKESEVVNEAMVSKEKVTAKNNKDKNKKKDKKNKKKKADKKDKDKKSSAKKKDKKKKGKKSKK